MNNSVELEEHKKWAALEAENATLRAQLQAADAKAAVEAQKLDRLQEQLSERSVFMHNLARAVPSALYIFHLTKRENTFLNDRLRHVLQYSAEEVRELKPNLIEALLHPDDISPLQLHHEALQYSPSGTVLQVEVRLLAKTGTWKWFSVKDTVFSRNKHGEIRQVVGSIQDISEQKAFTTRSLEQQRFYEEILNNIPSEISVFNTGQAYLFLNRRSKCRPELREWIIGKTDFDYCRQRNKDEGIARERQVKFQEALASRQEVAWEESFRKGTQPETFMLRKFCPVLDSTGEVSFVISYGLDITLLKQTESQLENQQGFTRQVIEASPNPLYVKDEKGRFILANEAFARLHGLNVSDLLNEERSMLRHDLERDLEIVSSNTTIGFEEQYTLPNGEPVWYHTTKKSFVRPDGSRYLLGISSDITDLKTASQKAQESALAKEIFLANMSHEIRTPMNGILGMVQLLKKEPLSDQQADYVGMMLDSAENLLVVINDILDFAKIEAGKVDLETMPFDVAKTVRDAAKSLTFKAEEKGIFLHTKIRSQDMPVVEGDPYRLHQILVNLINNAVKFTQKGEVAVMLDAAEQIGNQIFVRFCVEDTGIGIAKEKFDYIFESFNQAYSSTSRMYGGTGLGLTICKNLVELQGGRIWLESQPGKGSRFYFTIPYVISEKPIAQKNAAPQIKPDLLIGLSVLLAEDNHINQLIAVSILSEWQMNVHIANDGREALAKAQKTRYDLILMDIQMPHMSGIEATTILRAEPNPNQYTPIIALTANAMKTDVDSYAGSGFTDHLVKPYHEAALYQMIVRATRQEDAARPFVDRLLAKDVMPVGVTYNFSGLGKLADNPAFVQSMQQLFIDSVPGQIQELHDAVETQQSEKVAQLAHSLKSTFGNLQIHPGTDNLKEMEKLALAHAAAETIAPHLVIVEQTTSTIIDLFSAALRQES